MNQVKKKERQSNIELLRIIAMVLIVFHHFVVHGVLNYDLPATTLPLKYMSSNMTAQLIASCGKVGVDLFVMISGYFLITTTLSSGKMKKRLISLLLQIWFYSLVIFALNAAFHIIQLNRSLIVKAFLPISYGTYWFATAYVILYLFVPYINKCLIQLTKHEFLKLIAILIVIASFLPTFLPGSFSIAVNNVMLFILFYTTGAYLRLYPLQWRISEGMVGFILFIVSLLIMWGIIISLNLLAVARHSQHIFANTFYFSSNESFIVYLIALGLFLWGKNWHIQSNQFINTVASTVFGVYLIHDNPFSEEILWQHWLNLPSLIRGDWRNIIIEALIICPIVFAVCSLIEYLRQRLFIFVGNLLKKRN